MSEWLNTEKRVWKPSEIDKPCHKLGFPLHPEFDVLIHDLNKLGREGKLDTGYNCKFFGHDCPVFYHAERVSESDEMEVA